MIHTDHIAQNKHFLDQRFAITRLIREFFWSENFAEVETPNIVRLPGQEPYLSPIKLTINDEQKTKYTAFLHTSPEYTMKKMLAAGFADIFSIGKCYRDGESFGGLHNPEFTLLEWYRPNKDMWAIMDDVENMFGYVCERLQTSDFRLQKIADVRSPKSEVRFRRIHMRDLWREYVGVNLDEYLDVDSLRRLLITDYRLPISKNEPYEDLFYRIFLNKIEPHVKEPTIVHHYPAQMAALAKLSDKDPRYAERFEVYINGVEIANAFSELTDADEQRRRLEKERMHRYAMDKEVYDLDEDFLEAVSRMPPSAGIALGVDRLVMAMLDCKDINDVLALPSSKLF